MYYKKILIILFFIFFLISFSNINIDMSLVKKGSYQKKGNSIFLSYDIYIGISEITFDIYDKYCEQKNIDKILC